MSLIYDCKKCMHLDTDMCCECSVNSDRECTCWMNPPCGFCTNNQYTERSEE